MTENFYIPFEQQSPPNCRQCGHTLHDAWEGNQHRIGKHYYRTWTVVDGQRQADAIRKPAEREAK
jgi:hypothetical protein